MSAQITRDEVAHLARLARLALPDEQLDRLAGELQVILTAVSQVAQAAGADVPPTTHALPIVNVFRPDVVGPSLDRDLALSQARWSRTADFGFLACWRTKRDVGFDPQGRHRVARVA